MLNEFMNCKRHYMYKKLYVVIFFKQVNLITTLYSFAENKYVILSTFQLYL